MFIVEEQMRPLALDDEWVERREDVHQFGRIAAGALQRRRFSPMLLPARAFERDRHQLFAAHPCLDQAPDRRLARRIQMADRIQAHNALRA